MVSSAGSAVQMRTSRLARYYPGASWFKSRDPHRVADLRHAVRLEAATLAWNVAGVVVLAVAASQARSVALLAFALDSLLEIGASAVVLWELRDPEAGRRQRALVLLGWAFALLAVYLLVQSAVALAQAHHPERSVAGIAWTAATAVAMVALAEGKRRVGRRLANPVVLAEARVTAIDAILAAAVLVGLILNAAAGLAWADDAVGLVVAVYAAREARALLSGAPG
jgi:divalent metal cation (Fe/Co/Zn/Cd) transporter